MREGEEAPPCRGACQEQEQAPCLQPTTLQLLLLLPADWLLQSTIASPRRRRGGAGLDSRGGRRRAAQRAGKQQPFCAYEQLTYTQYVHKLPSPFPAICASTEQASCTLRCPPPPAATWGVAAAEEAAMEEGVGWVAGWVEGAGCRQGQGAMLLLSRYSRHAWIRGKQLAK